MDWTARVYNWSRFVLDQLYPPTCLLCGAPGKPPHDLCPGCRAELPWIGPACRCCARPLPQPGVCGACLRRPPPFDAAFAPLRYAYPVDRLLQGFKFNGRLAAGRLLGQLTAEALAGRVTPLPDLILPVPLHPARLRQRGYNQALELARPVARRLGVPLAPGLCRRVRATDAQSGLDAAARRRNVRGAFALTRAPQVGRIAVMDDVLATGSTVGEVARLLHRAGVEHVEVWTLGRAGSG